MAKKQVGKAKGKKKAAGESRPVGRPSTYSPEMADLICDLIIQGYSIHLMCADLENLPVESTVYKWCIDVPEFSEKLTRARLARSHAWEDEAIHIADDSSLDEIFTDEGKRMLNTEFVQRSKLRVETRLKLLAAHQPKKYGTKVVNEHSGPEGGPITFSNPERAAKLQHLLTLAMERAGKK